MNWRGMTDDLRASTLRLNQTVSPLVVPTLIVDEGINNEHR